MSEGYTNIPKSLVMSNELDIYEKVLLMVLLSYHGCEKISLSYAVLMTQTGIKRSKLALSIKSLKMKGYISVIKEKGVSTNLYKINKQEVRDGK